MNCHSRIEHTEFLGCWRCTILSFPPWHTYFILFRRESAPSFGHFVFVQVLHRRLSSFFHARDCEFAECLVPSGSFSDLVQGLYCRCFTRWKGTPKPVASNSSLLFPSFFSFLNIPNYIKLPFWDTRVASCLPSRVSEAFAKTRVRHEPLRLPQLFWNTLAMQVVLAWVTTNTTRSLLILFASLGYFLNLTQETIIQKYPE